MLHRDDSPLSPQDRILHFTPIGLALVCWALGLAYYGFYEGFDDGEPATWLSQMLMMVCLALLLPAKWNPELEPAKRRVAGILFVIGVIALLDEQFQGHETVGRMVKAGVTFIPIEIRHYTDDIMIVVGAIAGGYLLYRCVRLVQDKAGYFWYVFWVLVAALSHGVLDVLGHGRYLWLAVLHEPSRRQISLLNDVMSYFEESCKLWAEWFVILFLLAFFYRRRSSLLWPAQVFVGSIIAVVGIWGVENAREGVPYIWIGGSLRYMRNHHLLLTLALIWIAWAVIVWRRYRTNQRARNVAGLFFLAPSCLLVPGIAALPRSVAPSRPWIGSQLVWLGLAALGLVAGLAFWWSWRRWGPRVLLAILPLGLVGFSLEGLAAQPMKVLTAGGVLFPIAVFFVLRESRAGWPVLAAVLATAALIHNPLWLIGAWAVVLARTAELLGARRDAVPRRTWVVLVTLQLVTVFCILSLSLPRLLPNDKFRPRGMTMFETGHQPVVPERMRR